MLDFFHESSKKYHIHFILDSIIFALYAGIFMYSSGSNICLSNYLRRSSTFSVSNDGLSLLLKVIQFHVATRICGRSNFVGENFFLSLSQNETVHRAGNKAYNVQLDKKHIYRYLCADNLQDVLEQIHKTIKKDLKYLNFDTFSETYSLQQSSYQNGTFYCHMRFKLLFFFTISHTNSMGIQQQQ